MKSPSLQIIGKVEGNDPQFKDPENIFNEITEEKFPKLKKNIPGPGETVQRLKALATLPEVLGSIPPHTRKLTTICNFSYRGSDILPQTYMQAKTHCT